MKSTCVALRLPPAPETDTAPPCEFLAPFCNVSCCRVSVVLLTSNRNAPACASMTLALLIGPAPMIDVVFVMTILVLFVPLNVPGPRDTLITEQFVAALDNAP